MIIKLFECFENLLPVKECYFQKLEHGWWVRGSWGLKGGCGKGDFASGFSDRLWKHIDLARNLAFQIKFLKCIKIQKPLC